MTEGFESGMEEKSFRQGDSRALCGWSGVRRGHVRTIYFSF